MANEAPNSQRDGYRVLLLPPTTRDAEAIAKILLTEGIDSTICPTMRALAHELDQGAGALVIAEELLNADPAPLLACLHAQPVWSDLPIIVLSRAGAEPVTLAGTIPKLGNVTLLERPVRMTTMLSLVRSSLRARKRQYEIRDHLVKLMRTDEQLRESEERVRLAVETGRLGVWELDVVSNELRCSTLAKANFGRGPDDAFTYSDLWSSVHPDDLEQVRDYVHTAIAGENGYDTEYRCIWPDGTLHWLLERGSSPRTGVARTRMVGVTLDITERKAVEEQRAALLEAERAARAEAERTGRMKDEFLATLSHELRTPLNAILGWAQLLAQGNRTGEKLADGLRTIERNARAQTQIIEDLLDMSRIISGKVRLEVERVDLLSVLQSALDTVKHAADAKGVTLLTAFDPTAGVVSGDPNRLQQVFWNLLTNAVKFTPRGTSVQVVIERVGPDLEVSVIDSGEGIAAEFLPFVFDRFRQADASITRRHGGLGLGLAIVKQLVELHGGSVRADSGGQGSGAKFTVALPRASDTESSVESEHDVSPTSSRTPNRAETPDDISGVKVLVLDDEADSRDIVKRLLEDRQAIAVTAATSRQALELVQSERPDVIISDIGMPEEDGYTFIRKVRNLPQENGGSTPAVALTAYARAEDRQNAAQAGFQQHIAKPVQSSDLIAAIAHMVGR